MNALDFAAPESRDLIRENIFSEYDKPYEAVGLRKDGTRLHGEIRGMTTTYQGRNVRVTAMRDVTERKRAEETLRRSEARFRQLFEHSVDALFVIHDETREIVDCNREACRSLGYSRKELLTLRLDDFHASSSLRRRSGKRPSHMMEKLKTYVSSAYWQDIGAPDRYLQASHCASLVR